MRDALDRQAGTRVEGEEAEPAPVERQVAHRPAVAVGHVAVVVRVGEHPLRGALEHGELLDLVGDGRRDLEAAGAGADEREPRAPVVDRWSQRAEWNDGPAKSSMPGMSGIFGVLSAPTALMTTRASSTSVVPSAVRDGHGPTAGLVVEGGRLDRVSNRQCGSRSCASHDPLEVLPELGVLGEVLGPVVGGLERVAVEVAADVDARTRVAVLPPRAAGAAVLLDDRERQAGLGQADAGEQSPTRRTR